MNEPANLLHDAFAGTAEVYARHRPAYPEALIAEFREPGGRLLDLACGPGRICLRLADAFDSVWAVDLEPQMIEVGRAAAKRRGAYNIAWIVGPAERLEAAPGSFDLITIGEAFHRLDQRKVAALAFRWLRPGGRLAILGARGILDGPEPWQIAAAEFARGWTAPVFPTGWGDARKGAAVTAEGHAHVLRDAGFLVAADRDFDQPYAWDFADIVGYLHSTSVCSRRVLGDTAGRFEQALRTRLEPYAEPGPVWRETLRFSRTLAAKPA